MAGVRHARLKEVTVNSVFGHLQLDEEGRVTAPEGVTKEQLLSLPDFLDEELFPSSVQEEPPPPPPVVESSTEIDLSDDPDVNLKKILTGLAEDPKNLNSEGKLDMGKMNSALRSLGLKTISSSKRDALMG